MAKHKKRKHSKRRKGSRRGTSTSTALFGRGKGLWSLFGKIAPPVAFLDQLTSKNRGDFGNKDMFTRVKILSNMITGKIMNFNVFSDVNKYQQNLNPAGIANKYTAIGVVGLIGSLVAPRLGLRIPMMGKVFSLAKKLLPAGVLGGLFDDPAGYSHATYPYQVTGAASYTNPTVLTNTVRSGT